MSNWELIVCVLVVSGMFGLTFSMVYSLEKSRGGDLTDALNSYFAMLGIVLLVLFAGIIWLIVKAFQEDDETRLEKRTQDGVDTFKQIESAKNDDDITELMAQFVGRRK